MMPASAAWARNPALQPLPTQPAVPAWGPDGALAGDVLPAVGVLDRRGGDHDGEEQAERAGRYMLLTAFRPLPRIVSLGGLRGVGRRFHYSRADNRGRRLRRAAGLLADLAAEQAADRLGNPVGFPFRVIAVHGLARRKSWGRESPAIPVRFQF